MVGYCCGDCRAPISRGSLFTYYTGLLIALHRGVFGIGIFISSHRSVDVAQGAAFIIWLGTAAFPRPDHRL